MKLLLLKIYLRYSAKVDASYVFPSLYIWVLAYNCIMTWDQAHIFQELEVNGEFSQWNEHRVFRDILPFRGVKGVITSQLYHGIPDG